MGAPIADTMQVIGKAECLARLEALLNVKVDNE